jgi:hypothetical protein
VVNAIDPVCGDSLCVAVPHVKVTVSDCIHAAPVQLLKFVVELLLPLDDEHAINATTTSPAPRLLMPANVTRICDSLKALVVAGSESARP